MSIFQSSVLNKYLKQLDESTVMGAYKQYVSYFHDAAIQQNIRESKEEQFQAKFLDELFVNILGYTLNPQPNFNLTTEFKNIKNSRKADGAILLNGDAIAVIELKSTKTRDLESIRQQAFDYKANQPGCVYVITSNFEKLRFYINNAVDFEEFDLFAMSYKEFELLYMCMHRTHLLNHTPLKIKEASIHEEEAITKKFYSDYSLFKRELFRDIIKKNLRNPELRDLEEATGKKVLFKKTQKLLDRFLFIFFGEDRGLLPPNSISKILEQYDSLKKMDAYAPLYERYKKYFAYLNEGWKGQDYEIYAYNGGLFKPDPVLDTIIIDDELLYKHTAIFTKYDFESQVDVNILGHIFEHSLNEIESVNAEIDGVEFDKQKTKRKKDGVFYTPKYITKYIVDNTVGKLCQEKKQELDIREEEYFKGSKNRPKTTLIKLDEKLETYRAWLLELTICDPACGSGAFLNQALDFLIAEHRWIDEMSSKLHGGGLVFPDIENSILEKNIYGVDLNDESVEIAKLSLWLRTAQIGRKLTSLNDNIKCGNSLIDVKAVAGDKAFNWEREFPEVFANGGFDVVIGNPPYVRVQNIDEESVKYFNRKYSTAYKNYDLYVLFTERLEHILNQNGLSGYIMPKKFVTTDYGLHLKSYLFEKNFLRQFLDFGTLQVFEDATTYTGIFLFDKKVKKTFEYAKIEEIPSGIDNLSFATLNYSSLKSETWILLSKSEITLFEKLKKQGQPLIDKTEKLFQGLVTGKDSVFILEKSERGFYSKETDKFYEFNVDNELFRPLLKGSEIGRYNKPVSNNFIIFPYDVDGDKATLRSLESIKDSDDNIYNYLLENAPILKIRENGKFDTDSWYAYSRNQNIAQMPRPKIMTQVLAKRSTLTIDDLGVYCFVGGGTAGGYGIILKENYDQNSLLPILNSKLIQWYMQQYASPFRGGYFAYSKVTMSKFPILDSAPLELLEKSKSISKNVEIFEASANSLCRFIEKKFSLDKLTNKLQSWHGLTFAQFITELNAAIKKAGGNKLSKLDEMEWMELFEAKKKEAQELKSEIERVDREIDGMVYELYGLTEEEIGIVEGK